MKLDKHVSLFLVWADLWDERQHLAGAAGVTNLELGVRIDANDHLQAFVTWRQNGKSNRVESRFTQVELSHFVNSDLTLTNALRGLFRHFDSKVSLMQQEAALMPQENGE